jgi:hypothetical protein
MHHGILMRRKDFVMDRLMPSPPILLSPQTRRFSLFSCALYSHMKRSAEARVDLYGPLTIATGNQQTAAVGRNFVQSGGTIWAIALAFVACLLPSGVLTTHGYHGAADPVQTSSSYQTPSMEQSSFSDPVARQPSGDKITIVRFMHHRMRHQLN